MKDFMDRYEKEIKEHEEFEEVKRRDDATIGVITKEGYFYIVTENSVIFIGQQTGEKPPDLNESNVDFIITPQKEWVNSDVMVEIIPKAEIEGYLIEYSMDNVNWNLYTTPVTMTENGSIYARFTTALEETGEAFRKQISNIDKENPTGNIQATAAKNSITVSVTANDIAATNTNACSGIKGFCYSSNGGSTYTNITENATYTFNNLQQGTDYNIYVKVIDNADNEIVLNSVVTTTQPLYIVQDGVLKNSSYTAYANNGDHGGNSFRVQQMSGYVLLDSTSTYYNSAGISWFLGDCSKYSKAVIKLTIGEYGNGVSLRAGTTPIISVAAPADNTDYSYGILNILGNSSGEIGNPTEFPLGLTGTKQNMHVVLHYNQNNGAWLRDTKIYDLHLE